MFDWERILRGSGMMFVVFFVIAYFAYGSHPKVGGPAGELVSSHDGDSTRA